jgi:hypothetical protein
LGRFIQPEPLLSKRIFTQYVYAFNNPGGFVDPFGLDGIKLWNDPSWIGHRGFVTWAFQNEAKYNWRPFEKNIFVDLGTLYKLHDNPPSFSEKEYIEDLILFRRQQLDILYGPDGVAALTAQKIEDIQFGRDAQNWLTLASMVMGQIQAESMAPGPTPAPKPGSPRAAPVRPTPTTPAPPARTQPPPSPPPPSGTNAPPHANATGQGAGLGASAPRPLSWGNPRTLNRHFVDHGADFGAQTQDEYARMATEFLTQSQGKGFPTKIGPDGTIRVYDPTTNTFGSYNPDGTTKTFFKPNPTIHRLPTNTDYWNSQPGSAPWTTTSPP